MAKLLLPGFQKNLQDRKDKYCIMTTRSGDIRYMNDGDYIILNVQQYEACHEAIHEFSELKTKEELVKHVYECVRDIYFMYSINLGLPETTSLMFNMIYGNIYS